LNILGQEVKDNLDILGIRSEMLNEAVKGNGVEGTTL